MASLIHDSSPILQHSWQQSHNKVLHYGFRDAILSHLVTMYLNLERGNAVVVTSSGHWPGRETGGNSSQPRWARREVRRWPAFKRGGRGTWAGTRETRAKRQSLALVM